MAGREARRYHKKWWRPASLPSILLLLPKKRIRVRNSFALSLAAYLGKGGSETRPYKGYCIARRVTLAECRC